MSISQNWPVHPLKHSQIKFSSRLIHVPFPQSVNSHGNKIGVGVGEIDGIIDVGILLLEGIEDENIEVDGNGMRKSVVRVGKIIVSVISTVVVGMDCVLSDGSSVVCVSVEVDVVVAVNGADDGSMVIRGVGDRDIAAEVVVSCREGLVNRDKEKIGVDSVDEEIMDEGVGVSSNEVMVVVGSRKKSMLVVSGNKTSMLLVSGKRISVVVGTKTRLLAVGKMKSLNVGSKISMLLVSGNNKSVVVGLKMMLLVVGETKSLVVVGETKSVVIGNKMFMLLVSGNKTSVVVGTKIVVLVAAESLVAGNKILLVIGKKTSVLSGVRKSLVTGEEVIIDEDKLKDEGVRELVTGKLNEGVSMREVSASVCCIVVDVNMKNIGIEVVEISKKSVVEISKKSVGDIAKKSLVNKLELLGVGINEDSGIRDVSGMGVTIGTIVVVGGRKTSLKLSLGEIASVEVDGASVNTVRGIEIDVSTSEGVNMLMDTDNSEVGMGISTTVLVGVIISLDPIVNNTFVLATDSITIVVVGGKNTKDVSSILLLKSTELDGAKEGTVGVGEGMGMGVGVGVGVEVSISVVKTAVEKGLELTLSDVDANTVDRGVEVSIKLLCRERLGVNIVDTLGNDELENRDELDIEIVVLRTVDIKNGLSDKLILGDTDTLVERMLDKVMVGVRDINDEKNTLVESRISILGLILNENILLLVGVTIICITVVILSKSNALLIKN